MGRKQIMKTCPNCCNGFVGRGKATRICRTCKGSGRQSPDRDPAMDRMVCAFSNSGKTMKQLGVAMGYDPEIARQSVWQFLTKTNDPQISMVRRFAKALNLSMLQLLGSP